MDWIVNAANWFVGLFKTGGEVFISWMTGIVPLVLVLLVAMNSLIALIGEDKINKFAQGAGKNVGGATGRERHDQGDRLVGPGEGGEAGGRGDEQGDEGFFHGNRQSWKGGRLIRG